MDYVCPIRNIVRSGSLILLLNVSLLAQQQTFVRKKVTIPSSLRIVSEITDESNRHITIWIHGTRFFRHPYYYKSFDGKPGLRLATMLEPQCYLRNIAERLSVRAPDVFNMDNFYIFGWSGKLNAQERKIAAAVLYEELFQLKNKYQVRYGSAPRISIVTHSLGGAVALNLAAVAKERLLDELCIEQLILLACPVQEGTMNYIKDPIFKRIYAIHSSLDFVQIIAPQICYDVRDTKGGVVRKRFKFPPFSQRYFPDHDKLAQIKLKVNGRALLHQEFIGKKFLELLPCMIPVIDQWHTQEQSCSSRKLLSVRVSKGRRTCQDPSNKTVMVLA
jgi:hypothetical protein